MLEVVIILLYVKKVRKLTTVDKKTCLAAKNVINNLFTNEENYSGQFELTYTLNAWEAGIVPEFSWWGYINPGKIITQVFKNVELAASP